MTMAPFNNAPETGTRNGRTASRGAGAGALVGGAVFVSVIALCALVIAYNGIYRIALLVHDEGTFLAHVFPVTFALLVLMAFWVSYVLRAAPPRERLWVDVVLIPLLILAAAVPMVLNSMQLIDPLAAANPRLVQVVVAVAPLAALLVAFLLWITVRAHIRRRNNGARPRPKPSDDRTTVLRSRAETQVDEAPVRDEHEPEALKTRLLRLGSDEADEEEELAADRVDDRADNRVEARTAADGHAADEEDPLPAAIPLPTRTSTLRRDRAEQEQKERLEREEREQTAREREVREREQQEELERREREEREWAEREREEEALAETGSVSHLGAPPDRGSGTAEEPDDLAEASVPTLPLPRRARNGGNPIKRAAAEPPVVPGAAAPEADLEPEDEGSVEGPGEEADELWPVVVVPDHLADEGFEHDSPVADPSTDEAEAPAPAPVVVEPDPVATEAEPEVEAGAEAESVDDTLVDHTVELWPAGEAETGPLPEVEVLPQAEELEPAAEPEPTAEPEHGSLWEPPSDDVDTSPLADYVPPVWTPPEDDSPVEPAPLVGMATGAVEDTTPALDHDTGPEVRAAFRLGSVPPGAARPDPEPEPLPEPEQLPAQEAEPEPEPATERLTRPAPRPSKSLEKRPMVLKPRRPPMPDFASGPPSRRVRSEPLPPDEH